MNARPCESCDAAVYDLANDRTGKPAPIDAMPVEYGGNIRINLAAGTYHVLTKAERAASSTAALMRLAAGDDAPQASQLHHSHFFTCPAAVQWRRKSK